MPLSPQHLADCGVNVVVEQESQLPRRSEEVPGLVDIGRSQVRKRLQDRGGTVAVLQVALDSRDPDPRSLEDRDAGVHSPLADHPADCIFGSAGGSAYAGAQRVQPEHLLQDDLVRPDVAFP